MPDPIKDIMTQGASQLGMMNTQLATGIATALTQGASQLNMMAVSMAAAAPDVGALVPAGMPGLSAMPLMPGMAPARAPAAAGPTPAFTPAYRPRLIR